MRKILELQVQFGLIVGKEDWSLPQANIPEDEVLGVRAPGLTPGFNAQYEV